MNGGSFTGLGRLVQQGDFDVVADTTIAVDEFAWGNSFGMDLNSVYIHQSKTLTINSPGTGDPDNQFRGYMSTISVSD